MAQSRPRCKIFKGRNWLQTNYLRFNLTPLRFRDKLVSRSRFYKRSKRWKKPTSSVLR
jgi:hypothetical protein